MEVVTFYASEEGLRPCKKFPEDAGWDLRSKEKVEIKAWDTIAIDTGVSCIIPRGYVGILKIRSSLGLQGLNVTAGVIDADYRGVIHVVVQNLRDTPFAIEKQERFAQILLIPCLLTAETCIGEAPKNTQRAASGFGSTGKKEFQ